LYINLGKSQPLKLFKVGINSFPEVPRGQQHWFPRRVGVSHPLSKIIHRKKQIRVKIWALNRAFFHYLHYWVLHKYVLH
jgi:hypothetical protein